MPINCSVSTQGVSNSQDMIDSRNVIARIAELESELKSAFGEVCRDRNGEVMAHHNLSDEAWDALSTEKRAVLAQEAGLVLMGDFDVDAWVAENAPDGDELCVEYRDLTDLRDEAEGYSGDWKHGATLVRESYFEDYARSLAEDLGLISDDSKWPCTCIDWEKAADQLKADYSAVDFAGETYYVRN